MKTPIRRTEVRNPFFNLKPTMTKQASNLKLSTKVTTGKTKTLKTPNLKHQCDVSEVVNDIEEGVE